MRRYVCLAFCLVLVAVAESCSRHSPVLQSDAPAILKKFLEEPRRELGAGVFDRLPSESPEEAERWRKIPADQWPAILKDETCQSWPLFLYFIERNGVTNAIPALRQLSKSADEYVKTVSIETLFLIDRNMAPHDLIVDGVVSGRYDYNSTFGPEGTRNRHNFAILRKCRAYMTLLEGKIRGYPAIGNGASVTGDGNAADAKL